MLTFRGKKIQTIISTHICTYIRVCVCVCSKHSIMITQYNMLYITARELARYISMYIYMRMFKFRSLSLNDRYSIQLLIAVMHICMGVRVCNGTQLYRYRNQRIAIPPFTRLIGKHRVNRAVPFNS